MKLKVLKIDGSKGTAMSVDDAVFGIEPNKPVVRQAVLAELNNMRQGTHASKNRALVRGGGRKPFKQKTIPPGSGKNCPDQRNCG